MKILSIDQASYTAGLSILTGAESKDLIWYKELKMDKNLDFLSRVELLIDLILKTIKEEKIKHVIIEDIQYQQNAQTFKTLAWLQAIIVWNLRVRKINHTIVAPSTWRSKNGIKGRARKEQKANSIRLVQQIYGFDLEEDVAESILMGRSFFLNEDKKGKKK